MNISNDFALFCFLGYFATFQLEYFLQSILIYLIQSVFQNYIFIFFSSELCDFAREDLHEMKLPLEDIQWIIEDKTNQDEKDCLYHELDLFGFDIVAMHIIAISFSFVFTFAIGFSVYFDSLPIMQMYLCCMMTWITVTSTIKLSHQHDIHWIVHELESRWIHLQNHEKLIYSNIAFFPAIIYGLGHVMKSLEMKLFIGLLICTCIVSILYHQHHECKYIYLDRCMAGGMILFCGYRYIETFEWTCLHISILMSMIISLYCLSHKTPYALWHSRWHFAIGMTSFLLTLQQVSI